MSATEVTKEKRGGDQHFLSAACARNLYICVWAQLLIHAQLYETPWTAACQAPLSRQEYWSGLPFPSPKMLRIYSVYNFIISHHSFEASVLHMRKQNQEVQPCAWGHLPTKQQSKDSTLAQCPGPLRLSPCPWHLYWTTSGSVICWEHWGQGLFQLQGWGKHKVFSYTGVASQE